MRDMDQHVGGPSRGCRPSWVNPTRLKYPMRHSWLIPVILTVALVLGAVGQWSFWKTPFVVHRTGWSTRHQQSFVLLGASAAFWILGGVLAYRTMAKLRVWLLFWLVFGVLLVSLGSIGHAADVLRGDFSS
jgi:hypothetical protein